MKPTLPYRLFTLKWGNPLTNSIRFLACTVSSRTKILSLREQAKTRVTFPKHDNYMFFFAEMDDHINLRCVKCLFQARIILNNYHGFYVYWFLCRCTGIYIGMQTLIPRLLSCIDSFLYALITLLL